MLEGSWIIFCYKMFTMVEENFEFSCSKSFQNDWILLLFICCNVFFDLGLGNFFHQGMSLRRASLTENLRKGEFKLKTQPMGTNWQRAPTCALHSETIASWLKKKGTQMCKLSIDHAPFVLIRSRMKLFF